MDGLYLSKCDELVLLENQKKGLCLISAFFQGYYSQDHNRERQILEEIVDAMNFVKENRLNKNCDFDQLSGESMNIINAWTSDLISDVQSGHSLQGKCWNVEILESYIRNADIDCSIFYFREIPNENKFVLVKTRSNMKCPSKKSKSLAFVELANKHKMLVEQLPGELDYHTFFQDTDFSLPILYNFPLINYFASFAGHNLFLPIHFARLVQVTHFGACGYKCFSDLLGILV